MSQPSTSSGLKVASAVISAAPGRLRGLTVVGGSAVTTVILYDNASAASGLVLDKIVVPIGTPYRIDYDGGIVANNGIYCSIAGAGGEAVVHYDRG